MKTKETVKTYPDQYLHVYECRSGQEWIVPITDTDPLDLEAQLARWIESEFAGELELDGEIQPKLEGEFFARIITDGRSPDSPICWSSGGFWLKPTCE